LTDFEDAIPGTRRETTRLVASLNILAVIIGVFRVIGWIEDDTLVDVDINGSSWLRLSTCSEVDGGVEVSEW